MEIYLLRHGESYNSSIEYYCADKRIMNPPLTAKGINQAHMLANKLKTVKFDTIYASDLDRAIQTAEIFRAATNQEIIVTEQFREIDMGEINLRPWNEFPDIYEKWILHDTDLPYPNGECGDDVWNRCKRKINEAYCEGYGRIAIFCHGGTIRSIICGILGIPQYKRFLFGAPPHNCSISIVWYVKVNSALLVFNEYSHLEDEL